MSEFKETVPAEILRALTSSGRTATYAFAGPSPENLDAGTLARRIRGTTRALQELGLERGQVVPLLCPTSADLWTCFVGAMAADLVPTNLSLPTFKTHLPTYLRNLEALLHRYETDVVIASTEIQKRLLGAMTRKVRWIDAAHLRSESATGTGRDSSWPVAFLQHSSGSTGVPKGVALSHRAVLEHLQSYAEAIDLEPDRDVIASWLPLYHDMGLVTSFLLPLCHGVSCRSMTPEAFILDPLSFVLDMAGERATLTWWPNFAFALLADRLEAATNECKEGLDLSSIRALVNCSEVVMTSSIDRFIRAFESHGLRPNAVQASYAMAENVFAVTQTGLMGPRRIEADGSLLEAGKRPLIADTKPAAGRQKTLASSGRAIAGVGLKIVNQARTEVSEGVIGEIAIRGPFLFSEYLRLEDETAASRADGWYFTRDLGFLWQDELYVLGRDTDLIVVGGRKFLPNEVERIAGSVKGVKPGRAVAFGVRSEEKGTENAVVMVESGESGDPARARAIRREIVQSVLQQMDLALQDTRVVAEGRLIKTSSGKIARNDNRSAYLESKAGGSLD